MAIGFTRKKNVFLVPDDARILCAEENSTVCNILTIMRNKIKFKFETSKLCVRKRKGDMW